MKIRNISRPLAFSLVEVTLALGIVAMGLVVILGLLPVGMGMIKDNSDEATAMNIAAAVSVDLKSVPEGASQSPRYQIPVGTVNSGKAFFNAEGVWLGNVAEAASADGFPEAMYGAVWKVRGRFADAPPSVLVTVSWPAVAAKQSGSVDVLVILARNPNPSSP